MPVFGCGDGTTGGPEPAKGSTDRQKDNLLIMKCDYIIYTCLSIFTIPSQQCEGFSCTEKYDDPISDQLSFILSICNMKHTGEVQQKNRIKRA